MLKKTKINITLGIKGPILCKSTFSSAWGIDATFDRDYRGIPYIDRSHIKGKLREALKELGTDQSFIDRWLGRGDSDGGLLVISDLYPDDSPVNIRYDSRLTRTRMDRDRCVVDETALLHMENAFPPRREPYNWHGTIEFISEDTESAGVVEEIVAGLRWITAVGSEKVVGYGRVVSVKTEVVEEDISLPVDIKPVSPSSEWFTITIEAEEPLLLGGVKRATNYMESEEIITGAIIKGALAQTLNILCGVNKPRSIPIDENSEVVNHYPFLSKYFSQIRFTHAFPTTDDKRPVVIPYSAVFADGGFYDVAFCEDIKLINNKAPVFQTDWKDYPEEFGWAWPEKIVKTRTAIDPRLRKAEEMMMFTYQYVCPVDRDNNAVVWRGLIRLSETDDRAHLHAELLDVVPRIKQMGKRRGRVRIRVEPIKCSHVVEEGNLIVNDTAIITLQSDALMIDPDEMKTEQTAEKLRDLYTQYWQKASGNSLEMIRFFAHQKLLGGYLVKRRHDKYYPFYLTGAGSVFVLKIADSADSKAAEHKLLEWKNNGLPLPEWATRKYQGDNKPLWQICPFVPENGYGEVMVNLRWHFERDIRNAGGAK